MISLRQMATKRLYEEWKQHSKIIIAVDYDDTIFPYKNSNQEQCNRVLDIVKRAAEIGAYILMFTSCNKERFKEIIQYCRERGLKLDSINRNPIELPYGKNSKPYYNILLDDRAGLEESLSILNEVMYKIAGEKATESTMQQIF